MPVAIAGMHRSGTSMIAELLQACGLFLGREDEFLPANEYNAEGYFEHRGFVEINEGLLAYFSGDWFHPPVANASFHPDQVPASLTVRADSLLDLFAGHRFWGWKDPRNSLTLAYWQALIPGLKVILCLRNPLDVARSLAQRDRFAMLDSLDLWQTYNQRLMECASGDGIFITHYDAYFVNPQAELQRLLDWIGLSADPITMEKACASAVHSLRHNSSTLADLFIAGAPQDVVNLYAQMCAQAGPVYAKVAAKSTRKDDPPALGESELLHRLNDREPLLQTLTAQIGERERRIRALTLRVAEKEKKIDDLMLGRAWKLVSFSRLIVKPFLVWKHEGFAALIRKIFDHFTGPLRYPRWIRSHEPGPEGLRRQQAASAEFGYRPLISIIMPVYNVDLTVLEAAIESVRGQSYPEWELCIADDASTHGDIKPFLQRIASEEPRIKLIFRRENGHISRASNSAIGLASGEFVCMLDQDDVFYPHALFEIVKWLNQQPSLDVIYSDSDLVIGGRRRNPFFKPDWSPDLFHSNNYLNHLTVLRKSLVDTVGGFRAGFEGSQDYDLYLRVVRKTGAERIAHIPLVLYGWRSIPGSAASDLENKRYAIDAGQRALEQAVSSERNVGEIRPGILPNTFQVRRLIADNPLVSIIIPAGPAGLQACLDSIRDNCGYDNMEIITVADRQHSLLSGVNLQQVTWEKGQDEVGMRNLAVREARGKYLFFLSGKIRLITPASLPLLLEQAQREGMGMVGPKIIYGNAKVYSAGIALGIRTGIYGHLYQSRLDSSEHYFLNVPRNVLAVSELCLLVSRAAFEEAGGYDEQFDSALLANLDLGLRLYEAGYRNLYTPFATVYNQLPSKESLDRRASSFLSERWRKYLESDPYYSPNLARNRADFAL